MKQEIDRLREQNEQFMHLLKQQTPSNASRGEESMLKEQLAPADAAKR